MHILHKFVRRRNLYLPVALQPTKRGQDDVKWNFSTWPLFTTTRYCSSSSNMDRWDYCCLRLYRCAVVGCSFSFVHCEHRLVCRISAGSTVQRTYGEPSENKDITNKNYYYGLRELVVLGESISTIYLSYDR